MPSAELERARSCPTEEIQALLYAAEEEILVALLENPRLDEQSVVLLLERKDLSATLLDRIAGHKTWLADRRVRLGLVAHPHAPRRIALRLIRELHVMDIVALTLSLTVPAEVRRLGEDLLLGKIAQLALGQKISVARRCSARVAAALLAEGRPPVLRVALENQRLTEAQVLRVLTLLSCSSPSVSIRSGQR